MKFTLLWPERRAPRLRADDARIERAAGYGGALATRYGVHPRACADRLCVFLELREPRSTGAGGSHRSPRSPDINPCFSQFRHQHRVMKIRAF